MSLYYFYVKVNGDQIRTPVFKTDSDIHDICHSMLLNGELFNNIQIPEDPSEAPRIQILKSDYDGVEIIVTAKNDAEAYKMVDGIVHPKYP